MNLNLFKTLPFKVALGVYLLSLIRRVFRIPASFIYSHGGEDFIASHYLRYHFGLERGTYVDVGCHDALRYSNTFDLYKIGWRGICIDANKDLIAKFKSVRKEDICVVAAVSDTEREAVFHKSTEEAVSTIDEERLIEWKREWEFRPEDEEKVITRTLTSILDEHLQGEVDFLNVDVEGHDLQVIKGLDFEKYQPKVIVIEIHDRANIEENPIYQHLTSLGYKMEAAAVLSAYFIKQQNPSS